MALSIRELLVAMADERKKVRHDEGNLLACKSIGSHDQTLLDDDFVLVQQVNNLWPVMFETYFLSPSTRLAQPSTSATSDDDLVFYVTRKIESDSKHPVVGEHLLSLPTSRLPVFYSHLSLSTWWKSFVIMISNDDLTW